MYLFKHLAQYWILNYVTTVYFNGIQVLGRYLQVCVMPDKIEWLPVTICKVSFSTTSGRQTHRKELTWGAGGFGVAGWSPELRMTEAQTEPR